MWKLAPVRAPYRYDLVISYRVYMKGWDFIPRLREGTLHAGRSDCDAILDWMRKTTCALPIPDSRESDFMPERTVEPRLHDIGMHFGTGMKISLRYSDRGELTPV